MAYGLIINDTAGNEWLNSDTAFGFIEIMSFEVDTDGTTVPSPQPSGTLLGYSAIFPVYVPETIIDDETSANTRRPMLASTFNTGTGAWTVTQTWVGTSTGTTAMGGGRIIIYAH